MCDDAKSNHNRSTTQSLIGNGSDAVSNSSQYERKITNLELKRFEWSCELLMKPQDSRSTEREDESIGKISAISHKSQEECNRIFGSKQASPCIVISKAKRE